MLLVSILSFGPPVFSANRASTQAYSIFLAQKMLMMKNNSFVAALRHIKFGYLFTVVVEGEQMKELAVRFEKSQRNVTACAGVLLW